MAAISVDAGTTMIKAVGYDKAGAESVVVRQETALQRPEPGWVEQDMVEVWNAVVYAIREVTAELEEMGEPIDYIAVTAQGDGCWLIGPTGRPTGAAILWNDGRAAGIIDQWRRAGVLEAAFRINGSMGFAGLPNAILTWLQRHQPDRLDRSTAALTCGGWLYAQLTGRVGVDTSDGSAPFTDLATGAYSEDVLTLFDMGWARRLLPELLDGERRVAGLTPGAAAQVGLPAGTPVVLSAYDIASTAIGCGAVEPELACSILGTTLCTEVVTDDARGVTGGTAAGLTVQLGVEGRLLRAMPTLAGGEVISWCCRLLDLDTPGQLGDLIAGVEPGAGGLLFLPYLSPAGERAPFLDEQARGAFMGLSFEHTRRHVARAVLEGLTLVIRECLAASGTTPTELRVCGGGAANATWCQLIADITGVRTARCQDHEIGARGAMVMGAAHTGVVPDVATAVDRYVILRDGFEPDPTRHRAYQMLYADFRALREVASAGWPRLAAMRERTSGIAAPGPIPRVTPEELAGEEGYRVEPSQRTVTHPGRTPRRPR
jgi:erythritol kinase (D-erythritol 1-phosphate-forming)